MIIFSVNTSCETNVRIKYAKLEMSAVKRDHLQKETDCTQTNNIFVSHVSILPEYSQFKY